MTIEGSYAKTIFRNRHTGFTIFNLKLPHYDKNGRNIYTCRGTIPYYADKTPLKLEGEFVEDKENEIFAVTDSEINLTQDGLILSFLQSCLKTGMGTICAERVLAYLKVHSMTMEDLLQKGNAIDIVTSIKGFSRKGAIFFLNRMETSLHEFDLLKELAPYGVAHSNVHELYKEFGCDTRKAIQANPYRTLRIAKIPFSSIDAYSKSKGVDFCNSQRVIELCAMTYLSLDLLGHSYATLDDMVTLFRRTESFYSCYDEQIPEALIILELFSNKIGWVDSSSNELRFYTKFAHEAENKIVGHLTRLMSKKEELVKNDQIAHYLEKDGSYLDPCQQDAVYLLKDTTPSFLIGGPGTGKTTTIKNIVACYQNNFPDKKIALCAPTGRAAQRIKESSGMSAVTIHFLLEYMMDYSGSYPQRNADNPLDIDLLIIDEFSMVGIYLYASLLEAIPDHTKIIMVGDWNQLQSVEPGFLLHDLVETQCFSFVKLTSTHRQANGSSIITNANKILEGDATLLQDEQCEILRLTNKAEARVELKKIFEKHYDTEEIGQLMIMSPIRKGILGVEELNLVFQEHMHTDDEPYAAFGNNIFYADDKVMTTRNNYDACDGYFNGDIWKIHALEEDGALRLKGVDDYQILVEGENLEDVTLAYVSTIHKCQGSEGKIGVIVLPDDLPKVMMSKSLLYTGATRPTQKLIILSVGDMLEKIIAGEIHAQRNSGLKEKILRSEIVRFASK